MQGGAEQGGADGDLGEGGSEEGGEISYSVTKTGFRPGFLAQFSKSQFSLKCPVMSGLIFLIPVVPTVVNSSSEH